MPRFVRKTAQRTAGLTPGTLVHIGEKRTEKVRISIIDYDETQLEEKEAKTVEECFPYKDKPTVTWINVDGIHDMDVVEKIGKHFGLHPLILEDIVNTEQRPKLEDFGSHIFVVLKMLSFNKESNELEAEQVSLVFGSNFVISFQERVGDILEPVRERIRKAKGRVRKSGADYLAYALIDSIVDGYFVILEQLGESIEAAEEALSAHPTVETLQSIRAFKKEMIYLRKSIWPLREAVNSLGRGESSLVHESTGVYLRDVYDHTIQIMDTVETYRDMLAGMLDIYLSSMSNRMNEVMKVLTIFASIFIPLTFVAGVYGMNFKFMPELEWPLGYFAVLGFMAAIAASLVVYFRRRKWL